METVGTVANPGRRTQSPLDRPMKRKTAPGTARATEWASVSDRASDVQTPAVVAFACARKLIIPDRSTNGGQGSRHTPAQQLEHRFTHTHRKQCRHLQAQLEVNSRLRRLNSLCPVWRFRASRHSGKAGGRVARGPKERIDARGRDCGLQVIRDAFKGHEMSLFERIDHCVRRQGGKK